MTQAFLMKTAWVTWTLVTQLMLWFRRICV